MWFMSCTLPPPPNTIVKPPTSSISFPLTISILIENWIFMSNRTRTPFPFYCWRWRMMLTVWMEFWSSGTPRFPPLASNYERRRFERGIKIDVFCLEAKSLCFPNAPRVRIVLEEAAAWLPKPWVNRSMLQGVTYEHRTRASDYR